MTIKEYNNEFYPQAQKALNFIHCIEHAINKCDDEARRQIETQLERAILSS